MPAAFTPVDTANLPIPQILPIQFHRKAARSYTGFSLRRFSHKSPHNPPQGPTPRRRAAARGTPCCGQVPPTPRPLCHLLQRGKCGGIRPAVRRTQSKTERRPSSRIAPDPISKRTSCQYHLMHPYFHQRPACHSGMGRFFFILKHRENPSHIPPGEALRDKQKQHIKQAGAHDHQHNRSRTR